MDSSYIESTLEELTRQRNEWKASCQNGYKTEVSIDRGPAHHAVVNQLFRLDEDGTPLYRKHGYDPRTDWLDLYSSKDGDRCYMWLYQGKGYRVTL